MNFPFWCLKSIRWISKKGTCQPQIQKKWTWFFGTLWLCQIVDGFNSHHKSTSSDYLGVLEIFLHRPPKSSYNTRFQQPARTLACSSSASVTESQRFCLGCESLEKKSLEAADIKPLQTCRDKSHQTNQQYPLTVTHVIPLTTALHQKHKMTGEPKYRKATQRQHLWVKSLGMWAKAIPIMSWVSQP